MGSGVLVEVGNLDRLGLLLRLFLAALQVGDLFPQLAGFLLGLAALVLLPAIGFFAYRPRLGFILRFGGLLNRLSGSLNDLGQFRFAAGLEILVFFRRHGHRHGLIFQLLQNQFDGVLVVKIVHGPSDTGLFLLDHIELVHQMVDR